MSVAFIFPGQGSQHVGMGKSLYDNFTEAKHVFEEVDEALQQKLSTIIFEGPEELLTLTENTQPALMACSISILRVLEKISGKKIEELCSLVAGHSLGEFTALAATRAISLSETARLLQLRGQAMQRAVPAGQGAMFALLGANIEIANNIAREIRSRGEICEVANDNAMQQQVLSGTQDGIEAAIALAQAQGFKAIKLKVSAPFHSSLMIPAQRELTNALSKIEILAPCVPLIANVNAKVSDVTEIKENLIKQTTSTVLWCDSMQELKRMGVEKVVEIGPGNVCSNLMKRIDTTVEALVLNSADHIEQYVNRVNI